MGEQFDIYDEDHNPLGQAPRERAHREGLWHDAAYCWMVCRMGGRDWVYFQQRSFDKATYPGYYEVAATGHVAAGETHREAMVREMYEETGVRAEERRLHYLGVMKKELRTGDVLDREFAHIYGYELDVPAFAPGDEVERMIAVPAEELPLGTDGERVIRAVDLYGEALSLRAAEFCSHPGEYETFAGPWIAGRQGREGGDAR